MQFYNARTERMFHMTIEVRKAACGASSHANSDFAESVGIKARAGAALGPKADRTESHAGPRAFGYGDGGRICRPRSSNDLPGGGDSELEPLTAESTKLLPETEDACGHRQGEARNGFVRP